VQQLALFSPILIFFQDGKTRTTLFFRFLRQWIRQAFILKIMRLCYSFFRLRKEVPSFKLSIYANRFTKPGNHCLSNAIFLASTFWLDKAVPLTKPFYLDLQRNAFVPRAFFSSVEPSQVAVLGLFSNFTNSLTKRFTHPQNRHPVDGYQHFCHVKRLDRGRKTIRQPRKNRRSFISASYCFDPRGCPACSKQEVEANVRLLLRILLTLKSLDPTRRSDVRFKGDRM